MRIFDELDGMVSFTGVATFKNAPVVAETASWCPENRIMLETDSPYLSPEPLRGRMNDPPISFIQPVSSPLPEA